MSVEIKLRDGFANDTVIIRIDGREVYRKPQVTTDLAVSYADGLSLPIDRTTIDLRVEIVGGPTATKRITVEDSVFIDVRVINGEISLHESKEETPML